jgi:outer membrane protein assembly factor BamB
MSISVLTRAYGNDRSGTNSQESVLTAAAVRSRGIKRLFSLPLPGDRRGAEAQPLIVPAVALPGGRTRDLVLLATMANQVFAFDANDGTPVWERTLGTPINTRSRLCRRQGWHPLRRQAGRHGQDAAAGSRRSGR